MTKENISNTIEQKESSFGFKTQLASLLAVLSMQYGIAQTNAVNSDTTTKAKTEVVTTNDFPSPEKILEKHKISDIATATVEQLQAAFDEITNLLESETLKEDEEMSYITLRLKIRNQITVTKAKNETEKQRKKTALAKQIVEDLKGK